MLKTKCYTSVFLADCVNKLSGIMHTINKSTEALLGSNNETVLEVNA